MRLTHSVLAAALACAAPAAAELNFTTETAPVDSSRASAIVSDGYALYYLRTGAYTGGTGSLYVSGTGLTGDWFELASPNSMPGTEAGEIYGSAMAYWPTGNQLVISRWRDPSLGGTNPWDNERAAFYDMGTDTWSLHASSVPDALNSGLQVIDDTLYGIQHGGGQYFRSLLLTGTDADEGTTISGILGDDAGWLSRAAKLAVLDGLIYGIKNDWNTEPAGTGDRLFVIDPADWGTGPGGSTPATDLGRLPFEVGAGSALVAIPGEWYPDSQGALFIMAGASPSDHEGEWYTLANASDLYAIYDVATGVFHTCHLPGPSGAGGSAALHNGQLFVKRGVDEFGTYNADLWVGNPDWYKPDDLGVAYIARTPRYDYDGVPNNPANGELVTFHGYIQNLSPAPHPAVDYAWRLDGAVVDTGTLNNMASGEEREVTWSWSWDAANHTIALVVDPDDAYFEFSEANNVVEDRTNALGVGFWVEQSVYDYFRLYQWELGEAVGGNSWEDWARRQMGVWNTYCEEAIHPLTPDGVLDRVRIDKIIVVPDGSLPLGPWGLPSNHPDVDDHTVDLMWGFPATLLDGSFYADTTTVSENNAFYFERSLLHELGHARYLIDNYGFDVHDGQVNILEGGVPVAGSQWMPFIAFNSVLYYNVHGGLMGGPHPGWSEYEAAALNLIAGQRAVCGNYNAPCNIGVFLQDLPYNNHVRILDRYNRPRAGAEVRVYQAGPQAGVWYGKNFDDTPDLTFVTDAGGYAHMPRNPFAAGDIVHTYGQTNGIVILRVAHAGEIWYRFLEVTEFNMEFWRGHESDGYYAIALEGSEIAGADFDADGDIDLDDYAFFAGCLTGPGGGVAGGCDPADLDSDDDVDAADFADFQDDFTG